MEHTVKKHTYKVHHILYQAISLFPCNVQCKIELRQKIQFVLDNGLNGKHGIYKFLFSGYTYLHKYNISSFQLSTCTLSGLGTRARARTWRSGARPVKPFRSSGLTTEGNRKDYFSGRTKGRGGEERHRSYEEKTKLVV